MSANLVRCPFNKEHVMDVSSLQRHIIRCMVNYPNYVTCPYNALHRLKNTDLLAEHMMNCNSRTYTFEEDMKCNAYGKQPTDVHMDRAREINLKEENWDDEY